MNEKKEIIKDNVLKQVLNERIQLKKELGIAIDDIEIETIKRELQRENHIRTIFLTEKLTREQLSLEEKGCMKETKCRNCGQLKATETWRVCSVCGDILQDYLIDTYTERQKIISLIEKEIERLESWHRGECRNYPDCSGCYFLKCLQDLLKEIKEEIL